MSKTMRILRRQLLGPVFQNNLVMMLRLGQAVQASLVLPID
jgi:ribosomal protein S28E/S33